MSETTAGVRACGVDDLADGESIKIDVDPAIAVHRVAGQFFATQDLCTHSQWSLGEEGELEGFEITCTLHMATFDVRSGEAVCLPATVALRVYRVEVVGDDVIVYLD
jgi:nitrite reductase/ring-hydroxylating ferredoxin subunit